MSDEAEELGIFVAHGIVKGVKISRSSDVLERSAGEVRKLYDLEKLKDHPVARAYRDFYWRIGIDPTKVRPSGEALVRRILRGERIPSINSVVDSGNAASALTLIPIGLYDLSRVVGKLELRLARPGEVFYPIGGSERKLKGGEPVLADEIGPIFLYPHRDSERTKVREDTDEVLVVAAGVPGVERSDVRRALNLALELIRETSGGELIRSGTAPTR
ncbi:MAG: phenylalanine--tRNA ligase beta subunit-related protein [Candidatus Korarchaeum sp.]